MQSVPDDAKASLIAARSRCPNESGALSTIRPASARRFHAWSPIEVGHVGY